MSRPEITKARKAHDGRVRRGLEETWESPQCVKHTA